MFVLHNAVEMNNKVKKKSDNWSKKVTFTMKQRKYQISYLVKLQLQRESNTSIFYYWLHTQTNQPSNKQINTETNT